MRRSKIVSVTAILVASLVLLAACVPTAPGVPATAPAQPAPSTAVPAQPALPTTAPAASKVIRIATAQGCTTMSISLAGGMGPCEIQIHQIFEPLTWRTVDGKIVPLLATSWNMVDQNDWQVKLRQGVKFQNGEDFNADAVKFSYDKALDPKNNWPIRSNIQLIDRVDTVDNYTVNFHTSKPWPDFPFFAASVYIMPPKLTQQVGDDGLIANPVGTGPFQFVEFVPGDHLTLKAFDGYWGGRVKIDQVVWRIIPEPATRVASLQAGETDIAAQIPMDLLPVVKGDANLHVDFANEQVTLQLFMDTLPANGSPVADKRVRQAIDSAIDRDTIWKALMGGVGAVNGQMLTPGIFGYDPDIKPTPYDPDKAKQLLAAAGYPNGLKLQLQCPVGKYLVDRDACLAIKDQLAKVGIDVQANIMETAAWAPYLQDPKKRADMIYVGWYSYGNPAQAMQWFSKTQAWHRWENDQYDQLFLDAKTNTDDKARQQDYFKMAEIVKEEVPSVFLMQQAAPYGVSNRVLNFKPHPIQYIDLLHVDLKAPK